MKSRIIITAICLWHLSFTMYAQNKPSWVIESAVSNSQVSVNWFPTDPAVWKEGLKSGYTLTRENVSGGSNGAFTPVQITRKDSSWFRVQSNGIESVLSPIGSILYEDNFLNTSDKENDEIQFNYIVFESSIDSMVAGAVGLGYTDKNVTPGSTYKYTIRHNKSGQTTSVTIQCTDGETARQPKEYNHDFRWPNGNSLRDMLELSKPFVVKAIIGKARPKIDSVILRWVPSTIEICRDAMTDGYEIWRSGAGEDSVLIATVKPWTEAQIRQMSRSDTLAMLAAAFVMDQGLPQGIESASMFDQAAMESNYFGFALSAADRSQLAADVFGLRYVDREVTLGETYRYEIRTKRLTPNFPVPDIWVTNEFEPLTAPQNFKIEKNDRSVTLKWLPNGDVAYNSFIVERLNPGDSVYYPITKQPIVFIRSRELINHPVTYIDSLPSNNQVYMYRIKGSNAFGEWSDYAYGHGFGRDKTSPEPVSIVTGDFRKEEATIRISWTANTKDKDLKYHQVLMAENADYNFSAVSGDLPPSDTVFTMSLKDIDTDRSFYFKVNSVDSSGNLATSFAKYVVVPDHSRPNAPDVIKAGISPEGWVTITWSPSSSRDVVGYYVFFSNNDPQNLALVFDKPLNDTTFSWKIELNSLTKYIYVGVKSEDDYYNRSFLSEILKLRRPDTIPPVSPFLSKVEVKNENVILHWEKSGSADVQKYLIFTRNPEDSLAEWMVIDSVRKEILTYETQSDMYDGKIDYAVKSVDDFGNLSDYSNTGQAFLPFPGNKHVPQLQKLVEGKNTSVTISWQYNNPPGKGKNLAFKYQLFRSVGSQNVTMYKELPSAEISWSDENLTSGVLYNYAVRVKYDNGWTGELSEVKSILIK